MELTVLGKYGPYPKRGGGTSGYLLRAGEERILLDCGAGALSRMGEDVMELTCIVISHLHPDHISDLLLLEQAVRMVDPERRIDIYLPTEPEDVYGLLSSLPCFHVIPVTQRQRFTRGEAQLEFIPLSHPLQSYGVRITVEKEIFAYTGDTSFDIDLADLLHNAGCALMDAAFLKGTLPESPAHLSAQQAARFAEKEGVSQLILTHLFPGANELAAYQEASEEFKGTLWVAEEGRVYPL